ncbi:MAG: rane protein [Rhodocyclaceae bacterium]|nr:rane protein [Rhodocyclaceae bacterium]
MTSEAQPNPFAPPQSQLEGSAGGTDAIFKLNLFSAAGRIGRLRYLGYSMGFAFLIMLVAGFLSALVGSWLMFLGWAAVLYMQVMLAIKRSHDFNVTGWLAPLAFVPLLGLIFVFIPGTDGPNRFGNKPAPNGGAAMVAVLALVGIVVIGIAAAIAIPAYQQYVAKSQALKVR